MTPLFIKLFPGNGILLPPDVVRHPVLWKPEFLLLR